MSCTTVVSNLGPPGVIGLQVPEILDSRGGVSVIAVTKKTFFCVLTKSMVGLRERPLLVSLIPGQLIKGDTVV